MAPASLVQIIAEPAWTLGQVGRGSLALRDSQMPTWQQVFDTLFLRAGYNTNIVIVGTTLLGIAAGVIGVFALLRKRSLVTDALSHATLPGIAIAFLIATMVGINARSLPLLLLGGAVTGVLAVLSIQALLRATRLHEDAAIGIVLSVFFGAGIVGLSYIQNNAPSGAAGLNSFIYGQTAAMSRGDVILMGCIAVGAILATLLFLKEFALVCFNDGFARVLGLPVTPLDVVLMGLVVLITVAGLQAVGLILVVAMLIIPPVCARFWTERLWLLVLLSAAFGAASGYLGSVSSALLPRQPTGAVIVLVAGTLFVLSMVCAPTRGIVASEIRRFRFRLAIAGDHVLESTFERRLHRSADRTLQQNFDEAWAAEPWSPWFRVLVGLNLRAKGLIRTAQGKRSISDKGLLRGARVVRNHRLWEQYLTSYASIAPSHVDWSVDQVEHVLSEELVSELEAALQARGIELPRFDTNGVPT